MQTRREVLATNEINSLKLERDTDLYFRAVSLTNQVGSHACCAHRHIGMETFDIQGVQFFKEPVYECRFDFCKKQRYDHPGQGNLTLGMEPVHEAKIEMDGIQQAKFFSEQNHPHVLQQPVATLHWGRNADFQRSLTNNIIYDQILSLGIQYRTFVDGFQWIFSALRSSVLLKTSFSTSPATTQKEIHHLLT
jgi:hypothetical protein